MVRADLAGADEDMAALLFCFDFSEAVRYAIATALDGVVGLARGKPSANANGYAMYCNSRASALLSRGVKEVARTAPVYPSPSLGAMQSIQERLRHAGAANGALSANFMAANGL